jgi:hypothetical protein
MVNSVWNKEELPQRWRQSVVVLICGKKVDKTGCSNWSITIANYIQYFINILLSRLTACADIIIGDCHCGFCFNRYL